MTIIKKVMILFFVTGIFIVFIGCEKNNGVKIVYPDPSILGQDIADKLSARKWQIMSNRKTIYPKSIQLDIENNVVVGMLIKYDKSVDFSEIEKYLNNNYKEWVHDLKNPSQSLRMWRVTPQKFVIQLSIDSQCNRDVQLVFLKII